MPILIFVDELKIIFVFFIKENQKHNFLYNKFGLSSQA
jgi:hypothetical protein